MVLAYIQDFGLQTLFHFAQLAKYRFDLYNSNLEVVARAVHSCRSARYLASNGPHQKLWGALECTIVKKLEIEVQ